MVAALNSVVAVALTAFGSRQHGFGAHLVYSQRIGTSIWLLIDGGRLLLRRARPSRATMHSNRCAACWPLTPRRRSRGCGCG